MAFCPNCEYEIVADATECSRCKAQFGEGSAWKPVDKRRAPFATSSRAPRILSWFALVTGVLTAITPAMTLVVPVPPLSLFSVAFLIALGAATASAGYFGLKGQPWAFWVLLGVSLIQIVEYRSESFFISFIGPIAVRVGSVRYSSLTPTEFNINVLAVAVGLFALIVARRLTASSTRTRDEAARR